MVLESDDDSNAVVDGVRSIVESQNLIDRSGKKYIKILQFPI